MKNFDGKKIEKITKSLIKGFAFGGKQLNVEQFIALGNPGEFLQNYKKDMQKEKLKDLYGTECFKEAQGKINTSIEKQVHIAKTNRDIPNKTAYLLGLQNKNI